MARPEGLEPPTCCLEGSCSIQLSYGRKVQGWVMVGAVGFELTTLCSQSRCATRLRYAPTKARIVSARRAGCQMPNEEIADVTMFHICNYV